MADEWRNRDGGMNRWWSYTERPTPAWHTRKPTSDITDGCPCDWCRIIRNIDRNLSNIEQAVNKLTTPTKYTGDTPDHSTPPA